MYNRVMLIGRLGKDPEIRYTQSGTAVANVSMATTRSYSSKDGEKQTETTWHRLVFWGRVAEVVGEYLHKGSLVQVEGHIQVRDWEDKDGQKRQSFEINCQTMNMLDTKSGSNNSQQEDDGTPDMPKEIDYSADADDDADDDIPF